MAGGVTGGGVVGGGVVVKLPCFFSQNVPFLYKNFVFFSQSPLSGFFLSSPIFLALYLSLNLMLSPPPLKTPHSL